ncbi:triacylglycerol lipase [Shewanella sp. UCD-KL12]|uniref:esterase/lipase family protein n=1 Tax=Shewanella sp. UCD-KL12 TaxID=1917163 RepID=UPI0009705341|nr:alpha/beta fold hydrolase [Shewanella sp. UCD-KL12]
MLRSLFITALLLSLLPIESVAKECVVLLHGLGRSASSMEKLEEILTENGYIVANINYPSRKMPIESLANVAVTEGLEQCELLNTKQVNFVTHSLGGILVRQYYSQHSADSINRVVMLGPPNQGSELVDKLGSIPGYELITGEAGTQLGTDINSVPRRLGPVNFDLGVIAGTQSINLLMSSMLPNPDDGKVSVAATKAEGMNDFIALPTIHSHMMKNDAVIAEVIYFLNHGEFNHERQE